MTATARGPASGLVGERVGLQRDGALEHVRLLGGGRGRRHAGSGGSCGGLRSVEQGGQRGDEVVDLRVGEDERRGEPERVGLDRVDDEAGPWARSATAADDVGREHDGPVAGRSPRTPATSGWPVASTPLGEALAQLARRGRAGPPSRCVSSTARPAAQASGLPPKVVPCWPAVSRRRDVGPERRPARRSGRRRPGPWRGSWRRARSPACWKANQVPVRPMPVCTSSRTSSAPCVGGELAGQPQVGRVRPRSRRPRPGSARGRRAATSSVTAARRAASSPNGTCVDAGGQRLERLAVGRLVRSARGRPWCGRGRRPRRDDARCGRCRRASLNAASTASVPELAKKTAEPAGAPASSSSRSASAICGGLVKKLETCTSRAAWALTAATSAGARGRAR